MVAETVATMKVASAGGIGMLFAVAISDAETVAILLTGAISSMASYFYDWVHTHPRAKGLVVLSEAMKYMFYGVAMAFITYYLCINHCSVYIDLPLLAWGAVTALSSGSAVVIVKWFAKLADVFAMKRASK